MSWISCWNRTLIGSPENHRAPAARGAPAASSSRDGCRHFPVPPSPAVVDQCLVLAARKACRVPAPVLMVMQARPSALPNPVNAARIALFIFELLLQARARCRACGGGDAATSQCTRSDCAQRCVVATAVSSGPQSAGGRGPERGGARRPTIYYLFRGPILGRPYLI